MTSFFSLCERKHKIHFTLKQIPKMRGFEALILLLTISNGLSTDSQQSNKVVTNEESEEGSDSAIGRFTEPINSATKLLYDLDVEVQQLVPSDNPSAPNPSEYSADNEIGLTTTTTQEVQTGEPQIYSAINSELELALTKQGESVSALVTQLDTLHKRIEDTVNVLTSRRQYILSAMLRPMMNSVRRIRSNVVRIQTQLTSIQTAATSVGNRPGTQTLAAADQSAIDNIRKRVDELHKRIGDIIGRITSSLNVPGSASVSAVSQSSSKPSGR